jgi:hypothetical protein
MTFRFFVPIDGAKLLGAPRRLVTGFKASMADFKGGRITLSASVSGELIGGRFSDLVIFYQKVWPKGEQKRRISRQGVGCKIIS